MRYRKLGASGLKVSVIGIGTNRMGDRVDLETTKQIMHRAADLGVTLIDTANVYTGGKSEEFLGEAMEGLREKFVLATKVGWARGDEPNEGAVSRFNIMRNVETSLRKLKTDYIDLYWIHHWDPTTPLEESLRTMDDLVRSGKVRYIGVSNFAAWQLAWAVKAAEMNGFVPVSAVQPEYNMINRSVEAELRPCAEAFNVAIVPYFPLASGFLTGKYTRGYVPPDSRGEWQGYVKDLFTERNYAMMDQLKAFAEARGRTTVELALAWLLAQPQVATVINGVRNIEQLEMNARAHDWDLSPEALTEIEGILSAE